MRLIANVLCLLCLVISHAQLSADEVYLKDGRILSGEIVDDPSDGALTFKVITGSMTMVLNIKRSNIVQIKKGKTANEKALDKIQAQRLALADSAENAAAIWELALEAKRLKQGLLFKQYARDVVKIATDHADANLAIGNVLHEGTWMTSREMHLAKGEVFFEGNWISSETKEAIITERESLRLAAAERRAERAEERAAQRRERESKQTFTSIRYPTIDYGGIRLYHCSPLTTGLPSSGYRYGSSSSSSGSNFSFQASGNQSWGNWSFGWKN